MGIRSVDVDYSDMLESLNLATVATLQRRRDDADFKFVKRLLNGGIDCSELLVTIDFAVPARRLRRHELFHVKTYRTNYRAFSPLYRMLVSANNSDIDLFV